MVSALYGPPELVAVLAVRPPRSAFVERVDCSPVTRICRLAVEAVQACCACGTSLS